MDLQTRKIEFVKEFLKIQNEEIIARLEAILKNQHTQPSTTTNPMTMEEFNSRIEQSIEDSKNDKVTKASELKSKIDTWN